MRDGVPFSMDKRPSLPDMNHTVALHGRNVSLAKDPCNAVRGWPSTSASATAPEPGARRWRGSFVRPPLCVAYIAGGFNRLLGLPEQIVEQPQKAFHDVWTRLNELAESSSFAERMQKPYRAVGFADLFGNGIEGLALGFIVLRHDHYLSPTGDGADQLDQPVENGGQISRLDFIKAPDYVSGRIYEVIQSSHHAV